MFFTVIIPTYNSANTLYYTLSSLFSSRFPQSKFEVIIVDYHSIDDTLSIARKFPVKIYSITKKGAAAARNLGIQKSRGSIICFTDSDCMVPEDWLSKILNFFNNHPFVDGVGGPLFPYYYQNSIQKFAAEVFVEGKVFYNKTIEVKPGIFTSGYLMTSNCAYRKDVFNSVNFDESFLTAYEDVELCWNLAEKGNHLIFNPDIKMFHIFPWTLKGLFKQWFKYGMGATKLDKKYFGKNPIDELKSIYYNFTILGYVWMKHFFSLLSPLSSNKTSKLLNCFKLSSYYLGTVYGLLR